MKMLSGMDVFVNLPCIVISQGYRFKGLSLISLYFGYLKLSLDKIMAIGLFTTNLLVVNPFCIVKITRVIYKCVS